MNAIELIKSQVNIIEVLDRYIGINLQKKNIYKRNFNINCPFHHDKNPSFTVYTHTNTFNCWSGCNEGMPGDVIDIVRLSLNIDTRSAIKKIVRDFGLKINDNQVWSLERKKSAIQIEKELIKALSIKVQRNFKILKKFEHMSINLITNIKTLEDLEEIGDAYHLLSQIEYWFDCLLDSNPVIQLQSASEIESFLKKLNVKIGD